jgi:hypothetical protein
MKKEQQIQLLPPQPENGNGDHGIESWALLELFGHQRIVGKVTTQTLGVNVMLRVDVPSLTKDGKVIRKGFTRFYSPAAVYSLTPVDEQAVREMLPVVSGEPVKEWEYRFSRSRSDEDYT